MAVFQFFNEDGSVAFDPEVHRILRYVTTLDLTAWYQAGANSAIWYCDYSGIEPYQFMVTTGNITVKTNRFQYYNASAPLNQNPGLRTVDLYRF